MSVRRVVVEPRKMTKVWFPDEDDHFLLELAVTGKAVAIVTGDEKLLKLQVTSGIQILSPSLFCKRFHIKGRL